VTESLFDKLASESRRIEEDAEHSAKGHYNAADRWGRYHLWLGLPAAVLAAIASAAAFKKYPELAGVLAILTVALTTVLTFLKPSEHAENHKAMADQYLTLRNQTRIFRELDLETGADQEQAKARLLELANNRDEPNLIAPGIPRKDYEMAKKDIDEGRGKHQVDRA
jgi:hypothetical protein